MVTTRDTTLPSNPWRPLQPLDALPFVTVSVHRALARSQIGMVDTTRMLNPMDYAASALHPDELQLVEALPEARRALFISGRIALRAAIGRVDDRATSVALLRNARGAPIIPTGLIGSISHKRTTAVAMVAPTLATDIERATLGIDVEERAHLRRNQRDIAVRILTTNELHMLPTDAHTRADAVLLFFAMKEAIYKAIDPYVHRHVRFQEVELAGHDELTNDIGSGDVTLHLAEFAQQAPTVSVHWWKSEHHLFAVATSAMRTG
jgi:4'-phosphopantetheinyl transferase EntD